MSAAWMLYAAAVALLLTTGALAAEYVARVFHRPTRWVWLVALVASAAIPVVALIRPTEISSTSARAAAPVVSLAERGEHATPTLAPATPIARRTISVPQFQYLDRGMRAVVILSPVVALAYLLFAFLRVRRLTRSFDEGVIDGQAVLLSHDLGPALVGIVRSRVVVPRWLLALSPSDRRIVIAHERQHADAFDPLVLAVATVLLAMQPWNIVVWLLYARLRLAIETDCDQRVLRTHGDARTYGRLLLAVYERASASRLLRVAFVRRPSKLEHRIRRVMEGGPQRSTRKIGLALVSAAVVVGVACEMPAPTGRGGESAASGKALAYSVVGVQPPCMRNFFAPDPMVAINRLRSTARERRPEAVMRARDTAMVIALVLDENCAVTRDTALVKPTNVNAEQLFGVAFPDVTLPERSVGHVWDQVPSSKAPLHIVYAVIPSPALAARRARDECGFGIRFEEVCHARGPVVIRMMDSVRALVAVRQFKAENKPAEHVFLITLSRPNPALTTQTLRHGIVTYQSGALEISDFLTRDPPYVIAPRDPAFLYDPSKETWRPQRLPPRELRRINQIIGVAHYGTGWLTLEQIETLKPARKCEGARGACYEVGGRVIEFPA